MSTPNTKKIKIIIKYLKKRVPMNEKKLTNQQLFIIDGQLVGCVLYMLSLVASIIIIANQRKRALNQEEFLTNEESQNIALINKISIVLLILWFLYLNYKSYQLAKDTNQNTSSLNAQIFASFLSLAAGLITLYVVATDFNNTNFQTAEIENSYL